MNSFFRPLMRRSIASAALFVLLTGAASGQLPENGGFDDLAPGARPDCGEPAGAWGFAAEDLCECDPANFEIVDLMDVDGGDGNALRLAVDPLEFGFCFRSMHLANRFDEIREACGELVVVTFDIRVEEGFAGGNIYVGAAASGRGPQIGWHQNGTISYNGAVGPITVLEGYPWDEWQSVRLEIDLVADSYSIWWRPRDRDGPPVPLAQHVRFVGNHVLDRIDRFTVAWFPDSPFGAQNTLSYIDNVGVTVEELPALEGSVLDDAPVDDLTPGTWPDCDEPTGPWSFPRSYVVSGFCECEDENFMVVPADDVDPGADGNVLHHDVDVGSIGYCQRNIHLTRLFDRAIPEDCVDGPVTVSFDILVPDEGVGGGHVYVGGNHGGGGVSFELDRGPLMGWFADGRIRRAPGVQIGTYEWGRWQSVHLEIDLRADRYSVFWKPRDDEGRPALLAAAAPFQAALDHLDRFSVAHFSPDPVAGVARSTHSFIDNVAVCIGSLEDCLPSDRPLFIRGDGNDDGSVNIADPQYLLNFLFLGGPAPPCGAAGDGNGDGTMNIADPQYLLNHLFLGGPAPALPFPGCGPSGPSDEVLGCESSDACE